MNCMSPLRYPGGKASIANLLEDVIDLNNLRGCNYFEPYVGGAGAALKLLQSRAVSEIYINDADPRIYAFWSSVLYRPEQFVDAIISAPLDIAFWKKQKAICENPQNHSQFKLGFSTFFMNRCNRSGLLLGAGPIGGMTQNSKWRLDVRFNRENLAQRILSIAQRKDAIHLYNLDAIKFLKSILPYGTKRKKVFIYLDPPYVNKADRLYMNIYEKKDHIDIARYLIRQKSLRWLMSYDDTPLIRDLYKMLKIKHLPIRYSLQSKRLAQELVIAPNDLVLTTAFSDVEHSNFAIG